MDNMQSYKMTIDDLGNKSTSWTMSCGLDRIFHSRVVPLRVEGSLASYLPRGFLAILGKYTSLDVTPRIM